jgi:hypothetical protein
VAVGLGLAAALAGAACGRLGFDDQVSPPADAAAPALTPLACDLPTSSSGVISAMADQVAIAVSDDAVIAMSSDDSKAARVWSYAIAGGSLVAGAANAKLAEDCTGTLALAPSNGGVLASWSATGGATDLQQLSVAGAPIGAELGAQDAPASSALAASGVDGTLALVTIANSGEVDAITVDATGAPIGSSVQLIGPEVGAGDVELAPAGTGYALTWTDPRPSPNTKQIELLGPDLGVVAGPVTANTDAFDAENGQIAWAPTSNTYLSAWQHKNMVGNDEVNIRVFDAQLTPLSTQSLVIASNTSDPRIAGNGAGFWLTARGYNPDALIVDQIGGDGSVTALAPIQVSPLAWTIGARAGQPVVGWLEQDLMWLDTPCD